MKDIISRKQKGQSIAIRIDTFIEKVKKIDQSETRKISALVRNELRWLGVEGENPRYGLNTIRGYLCQYRVRIAKEMPFNSSYTKKIDKLGCENKEKLKAVIEARTPFEAMNEAGRIKSRIMEEGGTDPVIDALKGLKIAHKAYYQLHLKSSQKVSVKSASIKAIATKKDNRVAISTAVIDNVIIDHLINYSPETTTKYRLLAALILATGRRPVELALTGKLTPKTSKVCIFEGQVKKKFGAEAAPYEIPVLTANSEHVIKGIKAFRDTFKDNPIKDEADFNRKMSSEITRQVQHLLKSNDVTMYDCRAIYANILASQQTEDRDRYMARILGHGVNDVVTVNSYQGIELTDQTIDDAETAFKADRKRRERRDRLGKEKQGSKQEATPRASDKALAGRLGKLQEKCNKTGRAVSKINKWAVGYLLAGGRDEFTQSMVTREGGFSRPAIKKWLEIIG